jgi:hypothetical protein
MDFQEYGDFSSKKMRPLIETALFTEIDLRINYSTLTW